MVKNDSNTSSRLYVNDCIGCAYPKNRIQAMPTRSQGATWISTSLHHQLLSKFHQDGVSGHHHTITSSFLHLLRQLCLVNVLSRSEVQVFGTTCRTLSRTPDHSSCLSTDLKLTYLDNLLKYRLLLNFVTVPLTLVTTMLWHFKHDLDNNNNYYYNSDTLSVISLIVRISRATSL